jgi:hypothetical protein
MVKRRGVEHLFVNMIIKYQNTLIDQDNIMIYRRMFNLGVDALPP